VRAAWFDKFGPARDVLETGEQPDPVPGDGEVLVRLVTSAVNPSDVKKRAGSFPDLLNHGPVIPHSDGAGIVEAIGSGVSDRQVGDRVWVYQAQFERRLGTAAEFVAIDARRTALLPASAGYDTGACLGIPAMTAHRCVYADGDVNGLSVLVTGGAGRVGYYAIQWAVASGAKVIATASNADDESACLAAGAAAVVNHRQAGWSRQVLRANNSRKIDRVVDVEFGQNLPEVLDLIRVGGTIATYSSTVVPEPRLPFFRVMYLDLTIRAVIVYAMPESAKQQAIRDIEQCLHHGSLRHRIAARFPLADIAAAHETIESGTSRGVVLVDIA